MTKDCVSLEVAKKLQEVGYKSECRYYWNKDLVNNFWEVTKGANKNLMCDMADKMYGHRVVYLAPTATQLAEELPPFVRILNVGKLNKGKSWWEITDIRTGGVGKSPSIYSESLPDALGLCMIYLLQNNLIQQ